MSKIEIAFVCVNYDGFHYTQKMIDSLLQQNELESSFDISIIVTPLQSVPSGPAPEENSSSMSSSDPTNRLAPTRDLTGTRPNDETVMSFPLRGYDLPSVMFFSWCATQHIECTYRTKVYKDTTWTK